MAEEEPADDSLCVDTDDQEAEASAYLSPQMSLRSRSDYQTVPTSQNNSEQFHSISSQIYYDENSLDHLDITPELNEALDEG